MFAGTYAIRTVFPPTGPSKWGIAFLVASAVGSMGVGLSPQDSNLLAHSLALGVFLGGSASLVLLGGSIRAEPTWGRKWAYYSGGSGVAGGAATMVYLTGLSGPLWLGVAERIVVAPLLLWLVVVGVSLSLEWAGDFVRGCTTNTLTGQTSKQCRQPVHGPS